MSNNNVVRMVKARRVATLLPLEEEEGTFFVSDGMFSTDELLRMADFIHHGEITGIKLSDLEKLGWRIYSGGDSQL